MNLIWFTNLYCSESLINFFLYKSLSQKILKLLYLDEILLKSIGTEGRKNIVKKFNVEKMCFSTYSEYKRLLN